MPDNTRTSVTKSISAAKSQVEASILFESDVRDSPWSAEVASVLESAGCPDFETGLSRNEARSRLARFGPNLVHSAGPTPWWELLLRQFKSFVVLLLSVAAAVSAGFGDWVECCAIVAVLLINAAIGFVTEYRAVRSMDALRKLTNTMATVRRGGSLIRLAAREIVPGDIVVLEAGDIVPADLRLTESSQLQVDESSLTGESVPVEKIPDAVPAGSPLAERRCIAHKGAPVTRGTGAGVVTATGGDTEIGKISTLVAAAPDTASPLDRELNSLGGRLVWVTLVVTFVAVIWGIAAGKDAYLMVQTGIALAVAAVPEGLPIVATIALARGMRRMAKRNALINRLSAVETLGSTGIICTDKTGTLTRNEMTLVRIGLPEGDVVLDGANSNTTGHREQSASRNAMEVAALCNNAEIQSGESKVGDPLEVALLVGAEKTGVDLTDLEKRCPRVSETAFDSNVKMMATCHDCGDGTLRVAVKGAAEAVIQACSRLSSDEAERWLHRNSEMAGEGLRVIALAQKTIYSADEPVYEELTMLGLAGLLDPPRADIKSALRACQTAGIRVIMMTGDQGPTARSIAERVGLAGCDGKLAVIASDLIPDSIAQESDACSQLLRASVFSRVSPSQKLRLIKLHQENGAIVAMTGDGVNDAPALKQADIGVAMGMRGTEVAKESADMILRDDRFSTIVDAVYQGRVIFANIRRFVVYLMSCNLSEILVVGIGATIAEEVPILPLQILFLNLVTDVFPALALGAGSGDPAVMRQPPRSVSERILRTREWRQIIASSALLGCAVLGSHQVARQLLGLDGAQCVTVAFLVLAFAQLVHVFNLAPIRQIANNRFIWAALALCTGILVAAYAVPGLAAVLGLASIGMAGWILVTCGSIAPLCVSKAFIHGASLLQNHQLRSRSNPC